MHQTISINLVFWRLNALLLISELAYYHFYPRIPLHIHICTKNLNPVCDFSYSNVSKNVKTGKMTQPFTELLYLHLNFDTQVECVLQVENKPLMVG